MAVIYNADGSITVGIIPEEKPAKKEPTIEEPKEEKPKAKKKSK